MRYYTDAEKMPATVYTLHAADMSFFKIGHSMFLAERVRALSQNFEFNLEQSLCFHFENKRYALNAERELLDVMRGWEVPFDKPFPGCTEYFIGPGYHVLVIALTWKSLAGLITVQSIVESLCLEDYDAPAVKLDVPEADSGSESASAHVLTPGWRTMGWGLSPRRILIRSLQRRRGGRSD